MIIEFCLGLALLSHIASARVKSTPSAPLTYRVYYDLYDGKGWNLYSEHNTKESAETSEFQIWRNFRKWDDGATQIVSPGEHL